MGSQSVEKMPPEFTKVRVSFARYRITNNNGVSFYVDGEKFSQRICDLLNADLTASVSQSADAGEVAKKIVREWISQQVTLGTAHNNLGKLVDAIASALTTTRQQGQLFYVVSDVWMGRTLHHCPTAQQAARNQYLEVLQDHGYDEESDQSEILPEQFRAWPVASFPEHLEFEEAFDWIGARQQATAEIEALKAACNRALEDFEILITRGDLTEEPRAHQTRDLLRKVLGKASALKGRVK